jgi:DNA-binding NarL/FixJ family response regulator
VIPHGEWGSTTRRCTENTLTRIAVFLQDGCRRCGVDTVRVLIVDDQEPFRRAAAAVVEATDGFSFVGAAEDGEAAVEAVLVHRPDLVLVDVNMPGVDGLEATRRIRKLDPAPVVVLVSTYELSDLGEEALGCGASGYVAKSDLDSDCLCSVWDGVGR